MKKIALYPGSFDPVTRGHMDVIKRAARVFDELIVVVAHNADKKPLLTFDERCELLTATCAEFSNVRVDGWKGLIKDAIGHFGACTLVRGLRSVSDFEYEMHMAMLNRDLNKDCETVLLMPDPKYSFVSSRMIRELTKLGGDVTPYVPEQAAIILRKKLNDA